MNEYIDFTSEIPWNKMEILLALGDEFAFDPSSSIESESYFVELLSKYQECNDNLMDVLRENVKRDFAVVDKKPEWIQNPEWQFNDGKPMTFVAQLEVKKGKSGLESRMFYVFWDKETDTTKTIIQTT